MSCLFADGFDMYAIVADMVTPVGPWSSNATSSLTATTQFGTGQSYLLNASNTNSAVFATGSNESTVYLSIRVQTTGTAGSSTYAAFTVNDALTNQCAIRWNTDGSIGLYTGTPTGTLVQTFSSVFANNVWNSYQIKIVVHNTAGEITIRMNGSSTAVISRTGINTRGGTANNYANSLSVIASVGAGIRFDDIYLNNTGFPGDLRALQQRPLAATQTQLSLLAPSSLAVALFASTVTRAANFTMYTVFTPQSGTLTGVQIQMNSNFTGNVKVAIYDNTGSGGGPGTPLTSGSITNPTTILTTVTMSPSIVVDPTKTYYVAWDQDGSATYQSQTVGTNSYTGTTTYASFPATNPGSLTGPTSVSLPGCNVLITPDNSAGVQDLIEDGDSTYVFSSSTGEDKYSMSQILTTYNVVMVQPYMMYRRTDAGPRTLAVSLTANGSADTAVLTDSVVGNISYNFRFASLELDPTGVSWTPTTVNAAILGLTGG